MVVIASLTAVEQKRNVELPESEQGSVALVGTVFAIACALCGHAHMKAIASEQENAILALSIMSYSCPRIIPTPILPCHKLEYS